MKEITEFVRYRNDDFKVVVHIAINEQGLCRVNLNKAIKNTTIKNIMQEVMDTMENYKKE